MIFALWMVAAGSRSIVNTVGSSKTATKNYLGSSATRGVRMSPKRSTKNWPLCYETCGGSDTRQRQPQILCILVYKHLYLLLLLSMKIKDSGTEREYRLLCRSSRIKEMKPCNLSLVISGSAGCAYYFFSDKKNFIFGGPDAFQNHFCTSKATKFSFQ